MMSQIAQVMHDIKAIRSCDISAALRPRVAVQTSQVTVACAACVGRPPRPPPRSGRALPLAVALRDRRWLTLHRQHSTSPFAHTRAHDIRSARAHKHTCTLTHSTLSFFASLCHSARACMDGCTRATPSRSGVETGLPHSPVQPFQPSFVLITILFCCFFQVFFQKLRHPHFFRRLRACVTSTTHENQPQPRAPSRR